MGERADMDINELIEQVLKKNPKAQRMLFDRFSKKMMGVCMRYAKDESEAKDFLQEGFIKVFEKLELYQGLGSFEGWVRRIMVNTALEHLRKENKRRFHLEPEDVAEELSIGEMAHGEMERNELLKMIRTLPVGFRTVFNMYAIEGYSHKEIAEALEISENTSKSQYSRAKASLRKMYEELNKRFER